MDQLRANPDNFQFVYPDIEKMSITVKDMNIVAHAEGTSLYPALLFQLMALDKIDTCNPPSRRAMKVTDCSCLPWRGLRQQFHLLLTMP